MPNIATQLAIAPSPIFKKAQLPARTKPCEFDIAEGRVVLEVPKGFSRVSELSEDAKKAGILVKFEDKSKNAFLTFEREDGLDAKKQMEELFPLRMADFHSKLMKMGIQPEVTHVTNYGLGNLPAFGASFSVVKDNQTYVVREVQLIKVGSRVYSLTATTLDLDGNISGPAFISETRDYFERSRFTLKAK